MDELRRVCRHIEQGPRRVLLKDLLALSNKGLRAALKEALAPDPPPVPTVTIYPNDAWSFEMSGASSVPKGIFMKTARSFVKGRNWEEDGWILTKDEKKSFVGVTYYQYTRPRSIAVHAKVSGNPVEDFVTSVKGMSREDILEIMRQLQRQ